jgi:hypothetical protein
LTKRHGLTALHFRQFAFSKFERVLVFSKKYSRRNEWEKQGGKKSRRRFDDNIGKELQDSFS